MQYENLKKLLEEWEKFDFAKLTIPSHILRKERQSIAKALNNVVKKMKENGEYDRILPEEKEKIQQITNLLEKRYLD